MENRKKNLMEKLQMEQDYITYLLEAFEVPETVESEWYLKKCWVKKLLFSQWGLFSNVNGINEWIIDFTV